MPLVAPGEECFERINRLTNTPTTLADEQVERTDPRVRRHPLGYWEIADKPTAQELQQLYAEHYFQEQHGITRTTYPPEEIHYIQAKIRQAWAQVEAIRGSAAGRFLDVGCGEGFALAYFREMGWLCEGLDHSTAGVDKHHPELRDSVVVGDLNVLLNERIQQGSYDLIWLTHVLEHALDPAALLAGLRALLSGTGVLVVKVPNDFSAYQQALLRAGFIDRAFWVAPPDHLAYFNHESLQRIAVASGFECRALLSDFPIDWFLLHPGSNYVQRSESGKAAHQARIFFENTLDGLPAVQVNAFYSAMAAVGLGRSLTAFLTRKEL
jgi:2-polyprenyl-3-methyl-5-hydroxy-6-metoxy-1,4-benzoquinol methylase